MKVELLGTYGGSTDTAFLTSFLFNECLAVDAGCLTQTLSLARQRLVTDVLISHSHLDHTLSLPFLADNLFGERAEPLRIWAAPVVIDALKSHMFNEVTWPDFSALPSREAPTITFCPLAPEVPVEVCGLRVTPIPVAHVVPTQGFLIECPVADASVLYTADTSTTDRIWALASDRANLKAVIVDCSFPNEYEELARLSGHMTPSLLGRDLAKLGRACDILVYHIKPMYEDVLKAELAALGLPRLQTDLQSRILQW